MRVFERMQAVAIIVGISNCIETVRKRLNLNPYNVTVIRIDEIVQLI